MKIILTIFSLAIIILSLCLVFLDPKLRCSPYYAHAVTLCVVIAIFGAGLVVGGIWFLPFS